MRGLAVLGIVLFIGYILLIGAIIIWPIFNILAYLKVLIFPRPIRKKYGTNLSKLNSDSFDIEISEQDKKNINKLKKSIKSNKEKLVADIKLIEDKITSLKSKVANISSKISALGNLKKNNDGSFSQRSNDGKTAYALDSKRQEINSEIYYKESEIEDLKYHNKVRTEDINDEINDIKNKPWDAWYEWSTRYARYLTNKRAIIFMFIGFPVLFLVLGNGSIMAGFNAYVYISYIQPVSELFGIDNFASGFSSYFISYEYAITSLEIFEGTFDFWSWILYVLTMPALTGLLAYISYKSYIEKSTKVEPKLY